MLTCVENLLKYPTHQTAAHMHNEANGVFVFWWFHEIYLELFQSTRYQNLKRRLVKSEECKNPNAIQAPLGGIYLAYFEPALLHQKPQVVYFFSFIILLLRNETNDINFKVRTLCKTSPLCEGCLALSNKESVSRGRP